MAHVMAGFTPGMTPASALDGSRDRPESAAIIYRI